MNHCVPDFEIQMEDHQYPIPFSSAFPHPNKPDDGIMELLWQNGPVVLPSQTQRPLRKPPPLAREIPPENYHNQHLFMQEDEMASWLHYPIVDDDDSPLDHNFCADLLYSPPTANNDSTMQSNARTSQVTELRKPSSSVAPRPPIPPARRPEQVHESVHLSKHNVRVEQGRSSSRIAARESTVVDSCETPAAATAAASASRVSETVRSLTEPTEVDAWRGSMSTAGVTAPSTTTAGVETGGKEATTCDTTATSSPGGSSCSADVADRKRKGREAEDSECPSEDLDYESAEAKKLIRKTTSTKRSRAAEVHNLSERKRRDRINEKMRALQELIPRCNKSDKASMLDEAIEYLKSLQLQVQMMSMGCGMVPISMMYPGMQQYMPAMGMGMGMGMEMGMNRAVMSFPNMLAASALPAAAAHLGPRFPVAPLHMPHVELSRMQAAKQSSNMLTSLPTSDPTHSRIPNLTDPYLQYFGPHLIQFQLMQNQAMIQQNVSKSSTSRGPEDPENHQSENR